MSSSHHTKHKPRSLTPVGRAGKNHDKSAVHLSLRHHYLSRRRFSFRSYAPQSTLEHDIEESRRTPSLIEPKLEPSSPFFLTWPKIDDPTYTPTQPLANSVALDSDSSMGGVVPTSDSGAASISLEDHTVPAMFEHASAPFDGQPNRPNANVVNGEIRSTDSIVELSSPTPVATRTPYSENVARPTPVPSGPGHFITPALSQHPHLDASLPEKEDRLFNTADGRTQWYKTSGAYHLSFPPSMPDVVVGDLYLHHDTHNRSLQMWVLSKNLEWTIAKVGHRHPSIPGRVLWLRNNGDEPSWILKHTWVTYEGRRRKEGGA